MPDKAKDEGVWAKAKEAALKDHKESEDGFYAIVTAIYKKMGGKVGKAKAKASDPSELDTVRAKAGEDDAVTAAWSDAARKAALESRRAHIKEGSGFDVGNDLARTKEDTEIHLSPEEYAKPGHIIGYIKPDPSSSLGFMKRASHKHPVTGEDAIRVHVRKDVIKNAPFDLWAKASEEIDADTVHCRAASGVALALPEPWQQDKPVSFVYAPEGVHTITAGFRDGRITMTVVVDQETPRALQASFKAVAARRSQTPFADEEHEAHKATLRFPKDGTTFGWGAVKDSTGVVLAGGLPTSYGAEAVNGRTYESWSPEFLTDADYARANVSDDGHYTFPDGARGSASNPARLVGVGFTIGALTNKPAFHMMPPVKAAEKVKAAGTSEGAKKGWEHRGLRIQSYTRSVPQGSWRWQHRGKSSLIAYPAELGSSAPHMNSSNIEESHVRHGALGVGEESRYRIKPHTRKEAEEFANAIGYELIPHIGGDTGPWFTRQTSDPSKATDKAANPDAGPTVTAASPGLDFCQLAGLAAGLQVAHWSADTVTNAHKAIGELYESVAAKVDEFAEVYSGKTGALPLSGESFEVRAVGDHTALVEHGLATVESVRGVLSAGGDEDLLNILADIEAAYNRARYLLKAVDAEPAGTATASSTASPDAATVTATTTLPTASQILDRMLRNKAGLSAGEFKQEDYSVLAFQADAEGRESADWVADQGFWKRAKATVTARGISKDDPRYWAGVLECYKHLGGRIADGTVQASDAGQEHVAAILESKRLSSEAKKEALANVLSGKLNVDTVLAGKAEPEDTVARVMARMNKKNFGPDGLDGEPPRK